MAATADTPSILGYSDDPGAPDAPNAPIPRPVPRLGDAPLRTRIATQAPPPGEYDRQSPEFRYWVAADALRRASDFWGEILGANVPWHESVGSELTATLDDGEDFNAFYDRTGLVFFHGTVDGRTCFSGGSPDVVCHELGHAILDAIRPQLWNAHSAEPPAFHEAFGDISAMLTALQLPEVRQQVIAATQGRLDRSSPLSRLAEELGWAIRQTHPDSVDRDCLRDAANSLFYQDPIDLPPLAPANRLSSEPHSFSRVFSGAFLSALAGMFAQQPRQDADALQAISVGAGRLLVDAIRDAPITVAYYSQIAAHMLAADMHDSGTYTDALRAGFVRHGLLSIEDATGDLTPATPRQIAMVAPVADGNGGSAAELPRLALPGRRFGLRADLVVQAASEPKRYSVAAAAPDLGRVHGTSHDRAAAGFVEDLFRRGHVVVPEAVRTGREVFRPSRTATHEIREEDDTLVLTRRHFECGFGGHRE